MGNSQCSPEPPTAAAVGGNNGVSALAEHLCQFEITSQVPKDLSKHVRSSKKDQSNWYKELSKAWKELNPPPETPEEASRLIIHTLHRYQTPNLEGLLSFYSLPLPDSLVALAAGELSTGFKFELHTLPVDPRAVGDGDGVTVYVSTSDALESTRVLVPPEIQMAVVDRKEARAQRNYAKAEALYWKIKDAGYGVIHINNQDILARKYRIRLRGIDAPENAMPYGKEAKDELVKIIGGRCLRIFIFDEDRYGRLVGDMYCDGIFVQELMLKKGLAWHYTAYDKRPELEKWEKAARAKKIGLWASSNPEMPWEWRKNERDWHKLRFFTFVLGAMLLLCLLTWLFIKLGFFTIVLAAILCLFTLIFIK